MLSFFKLPEVREQHLSNTVHRQEKPGFSANALQYCSKLTPCFYDSQLASAIIYISQSL